ncbi:MAG: hypothetical protein ACT4P4_18280 [Betaproteobacteria bacterium]
MSQFQVQFVLDQTTGKYIAEMHNPDNGELLVRTEALYDSQAAAAMGVIEMFKNAILQFPKRGAKPAVRKAAPGKKAKKAAQKPARKAAKKKAARRPTRGRRSRRRG